ncbi:MAG TPA: response regulator [Planctomycetota bacterium]|nr:response regulator [Planctomycetota bacterium]
MRPKALLAESRAPRWRRYVAAIWTTAVLLGATLLLFFHYRALEKPELATFTLIAGFLVTALACGLIFLVSLLSERNRTAAALRESREQLSRVVDGSNDGFWDWHVPSGVTHRNERWAEMLGYSPDEIKNTHQQWETLVHTEDMKAAERLLEEHVAGRAPVYEAELRLRDKSGQWHWVLTRGKVASWVAPGKPEWITGTNVDIHTHRRTEQLLSLQYSATDILSRAETLEDAGAQVLRVLCENLDCKAGALFLASPDHAKLETVCAHGTPPHANARASGLAARAWASGALEWSIESGFAFPLRSGQKTIGAVELTGSNISKPDAALHGTLCKIADQIALFLQHKLAEGTLREREALLRSLGDNLPEGAIYQIVLDAATLKRSVNYISEGIEKLTGVSGERMRADSDLFYRFEPDDLAAFKKLADESARTLTVFDAEARYRLENGGTRWLHYRSAPRRLANGNTVWDGIVSDVSSRKASEERVKRYESIVNSIADLICMVNRDFVYHAINDAWCNALQKPRQSMIGSTMSDVLGDKIFSEHIKPHIERCFEGRPEFYQMWMDLGVHGRRHCSIAIYPYWGEPSRVTHVIVVTRDTTAENAAESQLIRAIQAAEEANRSKSIFLANMSHEIRTPMNAIIGMGYLLKQTQLSDKQADYATKIDSSARNLLRIINDILDFSKVEAGKVEIETEEFSLDEVLSNLVQMTTGQAQQKGLNFKVLVSPDVPGSLLGDPLRLGQVLLNLTSNAIKFTERGEVIVAVDRAESDIRGAVLRFSVKDTGIGLSEPQLKRIFEPFSQADVTTARRYGGTGLGLAISKRYVQMMGGQIEVQSKLGEGSTFSFTARFAHPTKNSRRVQAIRLLVSGRRALIVDHDDSSRATLQTILKQLSFAVTTAESPEGALREIKQHRDNEQNFDLVLYDHSLPGLDWASAAKALREAHAKSAQPAMILLAAPEAGGVNAALAAGAGFDKMLMKPASRSALYDGIMQAFAKSAQRSASVRASGEIEKPVADKILRGKRILLVEDNEINQQVAEEILIMAGCKVRIAGNGVEALSILLNDAPEIKFDAVLMDLQMPDMDGYKVTRCIRADKSFANLPIIAMTADAVSGVREACLDAGMDDYLTKPIRFDELYQTLARRIREAGGKTAVTEAVAESEKSATAQTAARVSGAPLHSSSRVPQTGAPEARPADIKSERIDDARRSGWTRAVQMPQLEPARPPFVPPGLPLAAARTSNPGLQAVGGAPNPAELDTDSGIARVGGNRELFFRLLQHFCTKYGQMVEDVDGMLARGERDTALRTLHTIKGVAANLGVDALSHEAARWEAALKANLPAPALAESRERFVRTARQTLKNISDMLSGMQRQAPLNQAARSSSGTLPLGVDQAKRSGEHPAVSGAGPLEHPQFDQLAALLQNADIGAIKLAQSISEELRGKSGAEHFAPVIELAQQFKYPNAAEALKALRAR